MSSGPVKPIKNPITYPGRIIWIGGVPYPDPGGERKSTVPPVFLNKKGKLIK